MASITVPRIRRSRVTLLLVGMMGRLFSTSVVVRAFSPSLLRRHPSVLAPSALLSTLSGTELDELNAKIKSKGDEIRNLKAAGTTKPDLAPHVEELLALKAQLPADNNGSAAPQTSQPKKKAKSTKKKPAAAKKSMEEMSDNELRLSRLSKVEAMKEAGLEPFEYTYQTTHTAGELARLYEGRLDPGEEDEEADVSIAGRVMTRRVFGKLAFFTLQDETGTIQLQFDKSRLAESFKVSCFLVLYSLMSLFVKLQGSPPTLKILSRRCNNRST